MQISEKQIEAAARAIAETPPAHGMETRDGRDVIIQDYRQTAYAALEAALSAAEPKPDFWDVEEARENKLATVVAPDNGTTAEVLSAVLECAEAWVPEARIIGNVRAGDIARVVRSALSARVQDVAGLPQDVIDLVIAAREFWDIHNDMERESNALDKALEKFASRVPFEDANLIDLAAPAKQEGGHD